MHLQGPRSREALVALGEGAEVGGLVGAVVVVLRGRLRLPLPAAAVVHEVGLQVPLAPVPDPTRLAGEDVLWRGEHTNTQGERERLGVMPGTRVHTNATTTTHELAKLSGCRGQAVRLSNTHTHTHTQSLR